MAIQLRRKNQGLHYVVVNSEVRQIIRWVKPGKTEIINIGDVPYWLRKKDFAEAKRVQRVNLLAYTGKWPRLAVLWQRLKEFI